MLSAAFALFLAAATLVQGGAGDEVSRAKDLALARGRVFMELKQFDLAAEQFQHAWREDPLDLDVRMLEALALYAGARTEEALVALAAVAAMQPDFAMAAEFMGRCLFQLERFEEADAALSRALELDPSDARSCNQRGVVRLRLGQREAALADFLAATQVDPLHAVAHYNAGVLLQAGGDLRAAQSHLEVAARLSPRDPDPAAALGDLHRELGAAERAREWYQAAADLRPERAHLWMLLALACRDARDLGAAQTALETAATRPDATASTFLLLAEVQAQRGLDQDALASLDAGLCHAPDAPLLHRRIADLAEDLGQTGRAAQHLERACRAGGAQANELRRLSALHEALSDADAALQWFRLLVETNRGSVADLVAIADRMVASRVEGIRDVEAGQRIAHAMVQRTRGRNVAAVVVLARAEVALGRSSEAAAMLRRAADLFDPAGAVSALLAERAAALRR